jgi:hypothetical protein
LKGVAPSAKKIGMDGTFSEIAIVNYRLPFADQGNKLPFSVCLPFLFSVCSKQTEVAVFHYLSSRIADLQVLAFFYLELSPVV